MNNTETFGQSPSPSISNRDKLILDWQAAQAAMKAAVELERTLRADVIAACSEADENASGIENIDIGQGFDLKIGHKLDYKLKDTGQFTVDGALDAIEKTVEHGELLAERLVSFEPKISVTEYKALPPKAKTIIDRVLTIKPASKSVEIKKRAK